MSQLIKKFKYSKTKFTLQKKTKTHRDNNNSNNNINCFRYFGESYEEQIIKNIKNEDNQNTLLMIHISNNYMKNKIINL